MEQPTEIRTAEVRDRSSLNNQGTFLARVSNDGQSDQIVYYVSPYASSAKAGMIAVPEIGTPILVCRPTGSKSWYYLGSTFAPEFVPSPDQVEGGGPAGGSGGSPPFERIDPTMGKVSGVPNKIVLHGNHGQGLEISDERDGVTTWGVKTELLSSSKKKITLHDSPGIDSIKLDSGNNASITLTQNPDNPQKSAASIEVDCNGPQIHISRESDLECRVAKGGRDLNIINNANGVAWGKIAGVPDPNATVTAGNVNIQSNQGDVNIASNSPFTGRIFIETLNPAGETQLIQLKTNSETGAIVLSTQGTIALDAGEIVMQSRGNIALGCGGVFSVEPAGGVAMQSPANIDLEGATVNLAPGSAPTVPVGPIITATTQTPLNTNDYFGRGVE